METDSELIRTEKYIEEQYPIGIDFTNRLRAGQSIVTAVVKATDENGIDVTASLTVTSQVQTPLIVTVLRKDAGQKGRNYNFRFTALTQNDKLTQALVLAVK